MLTALDAKNILQRVIISDETISEKSDIDALRNSLQAAKISSITPPFSAVEGYLHTELIKIRADSITCLKAWALMSDIRSHRLIEQEKLKEKAPDGA